MERQPKSGFQVVLGMVEQSNNRGPGPDPMRVPFFVLDKDLILQYCTEHSVVTLFHWSLESGFMVV